MSFLSILLIIILILILAILITILVIFNGVKKTVGVGTLSSIFSAIRNRKYLEMTEYARIKNVSGMTKLVEPLVLEDFSDFNKNVLYQKVESNLQKIFNALENKSTDNIKNDDELIMLYKNIEEKINDLISCNLSVKYDGVKFHTHALKRYYKSKDMATIEVSSSVEYYYDEQGNDNVKISKKIKDVKKQTRYTTKFVYIYDESKFNYEEMGFTISCPNCGAPISGIKNKKCSYCSSHIEPINLKSWKMIAYSEDYSNI